MSLKGEVQTCHPLWTANFDFDHSDVIVGGKYNVSIFWRQQESCFFLSSFSFLEIPFSLGLGDQNKAPWQRPDWSFAVNFLHERN